MTLFDLPPGNDAPRAPGDAVPDAAGSVVPEAAGPAPGKTRVALGLAYDGSGYHGFAAQPGIHTVAGDLDAALAHLEGAEVPLVCAGRTDTGVHALAQVVHADLDTDRLAARFGASGAPLEELPALARAVDRQLGRGASCWRALSVPQAFHARFAATARRYRYEIDVGAPRDPRRRHVAWQHDGPLDLSVMRIATDAVVGEHDFAAFCRRPPSRPDASLVRRVRVARWSVAPGGLVFEIEANAFCHQMVRALVGALVATGSGRLRPSGFVALLRSASRTGAPTLAPPEGLCLVGVSFPEELGGSWGAPPVSGA